MRIGIDVGGTNTDAVLMDGRDVLAEVEDADDGGRDRRASSTALARARRGVGRRGVAACRR